MTFKELNIIETIIKSLEEQGYTTPSPIQDEAIPILLNGEDILGTAQTGTGKTAAFAIPILQNLNKNYPNKTGYRRIKALVLSPTRELATQIKDSFVSYGKYLGYKTTVIFGGVTQHNQVRSLNSGVDILVATPGRLLDLMHQKLVDLREVKYLVLDEADRMLDMGFINDVNKIVSYIPKDRQTMLFSATLPKEITKIANELLTNPKRVSVTPVETPINTVKQTVYKLIKKDKINLLIDILCEKDAPAALVFSRTKHGANKIVTDLLKAGITASAIHGNKSQSARELSLRNFKDKKIQALVATDIASRGIDINDLELVINYDLPEVPETYIHRIGRTGRAGRGGTAITFCNPEERDLLVAIEKHTNINLPVNTDHRYDCSNEMNRIESKIEVKKTPYSKGRTSNNSIEFRDRNKSKDKKEYIGKTEFKESKKFKDKKESNGRTEFRDPKKAEDKKGISVKSEFRNRNKPKDVYSENKESKPSKSYNQKKTIKY
jgi:ATP-dependent RNA helicase RhlE